MKNNYERRFGFHSIESILKNNPYKIKKLFIPQSRNDNRVQNIKILAKKNGIRYEISKKLKQDPEAYIQTENNLGFKDLKEFIKKSKNNNLLLLILDKHRYNQFYLFLSLIQQQHLGRIYLHKIVYFQ